MKPRILSALAAAALLVSGASSGLAAGPKPAKAKAAPKVTLRVAALLPMTGPGASFGEYVKKGLDVAKDEISARYGSRLTIDLDIVDSRSMPKDGVSALQASIAVKRPDAVIAALSAIAKAVVPVLEEEKILTVVTLTSLTGLPDGTKNVVRMYPTSADFVLPMAAYICKKHSRPAILYVNDDFGQSNRRIFSEAVAKAGKAVSAAEPYQIAEPDVRPIIQRVLNAKPDSVFVTGYGPAFVNVLRQVREMGSNLPVYSDIAFANPAVIDALGKAGDGIEFVGTDLDVTGKVGGVPGEFKKSYRRRFGSDPYLGAAFARDSLFLIAEGALKAGRAPAKGEVIGLSPFDGAGGKVQLNSEGENIVPVLLLRREKGETKSSRW